LKKIKAVSKDGKHPRFKIPNFWHSFEPKVSRAPWITVIFGLLLFVVALVLALLSFTRGDGAINATTIRFVIVPLLLFLGAYLAFSKWPTNLVDKDIDVNDSIYHLLCLLLTVLLCREKSTFLLFIIIALQCRCDHPDNLAECQIPWTSNHMSSCCFLRRTASISLGLRGKHVDEATCHIHDAETTANHQPVFDRRHSAGPDQRSYRPCLLDLEKSVPAAFV